jgi:hypothetical protein
MIRKALMAAAVLPLFLSVSSHAGTTADLLNAVQALALKCVVRPVVVDPRTGRGMYGQPRSTCVELQVLDTRHDPAAVARAVLWLDRYQVKAVLTMSELSDGGDLDHLFLYDAFDRLVAKRENIPAFGNILIALAGGDVGIRTSDR